LHRAFLELNRACNTSRSSPFIAYFRGCLSVAR